MALSYGDGMAALIGKKFNYKVFKIWGNTKVYLWLYGNAD